MVAKAIIAKTERLLLSFKNFFISSFPPMLISSYNTIQDNSYIIACNSAFGV